MPRSTAPLLCTLALAMSASACADNPVAPRMSDACDALVGASAATSLSARMNRDEFGPVLSDAAARLAPAVNAGGSGTEFQRALNSLAAQWPNRTDASCGALADAVSSLRLLPRDEATDADRAALQLALDQAVVLMTDEDIR
jgi:hypothetical protein